MNRSATTRKHALLRTALLGITGALSLGAQAGEPRPPNEVTASVAVSFADLDITGAAGAQTLYARIRAAASEVCGPEPGVLDLRESADYNACYQQAVAKAVNRVGSDQLHAVHAAQSGRSRAG